jgi:hypothetical protein
MKLRDFEYIKGKKPELCEDVRWAIGPVALFVSLFLVDFSSSLIGEKNWRTVIYIYLKVLHYFLGISRRMSSILKGTISPD